MANEREQVESARLRESAEYDAMIIVKLKTENAKLRDQVQYCQKAMRSWATRLDAIKDEMGLTDLTNSAKEKQRNLAEPDPPDPFDDPAIIDTIHASAKRGAAECVALLEAIEEEIDRDEHTKHTPEV